MNHHIARRRIRVVAAIAGGVAVLVLTVAGAAWMYALTPSGQARLARVVMQRLALTVPGLKIARLGSTSSAWLTAVDVNLFDASGARAVHIDRLRVRPRWSSLLPSRRLNVEYVGVEGLVVDARVAADGIWNLSTLVRAAPPVAASPSPPQPSAAATAWRLGELAISDGRIAIHRADGDSIVLARLTLKASAAGEGTVLQLTVHELRGDLGLPGQPVSSLVVAGRFRRDGDGLTLAASARTEAFGSASMSGSAVLASSGTPSGGIADFDVAVRLERVALSAFAALSPRIPEGVISGRVTMRGGGVPLQPGGRLAVSASISEATLAGVHVDEFHVDASANDDRWSVSNLTARGAGVAVRVAANGTGTRGRARVEVELARAASAAAIRWSASPLPSLAGRGRFVATAEGRWPDDVRFRVVGDARRVVVGHRGEAGSISINVNGTARRAHGWSLYSDGRIQVAGLAAKAVSADALTLSWAAHGPLSSPIGSATVVARRLRLARPHVTLSSLNAQIRGDIHRVALTAHARGAEGQGDLVAELRRHPHDLTITVARAFVDVQQSAGRQKVTLLGPATVIVHDETDEAVISGVEVRSEGPIASGALSLTGVVAWPGRVRKAPSGHLALALHKVAAREVPPIDADLVVDLTPERAVDGRGGARARLRGELDARLANGPVRVQAKVDVPLSATPPTGASSLAGWRIASSGAVTAAIESAAIDLATLPSLRAVLARRGLVGGIFTVRASVSGDVADPQASIVADVRNLQYRDVTGDGRDAVVRGIPGIAVALNVATHARRIGATAQLSLYGGGFATGSAELELGLFDLLRGADLRRAPLSARFDLPRFQIAALRSLSDELRDTSGWLSANGQLTGTLAEPRGVAELSLADGRVDRIALGPVAAHVESDGRTLHGTARIQTGATGHLIARADVTLGPAPRLSAVVDVRGLDPGFLRPFVPGLRELGGVIDAHLAATGSWPRPSIAGQAYFYRGRVGLVGEPTFHDVGLALTLGDMHLKLDRLQIFSGEGTLTGTGEAELDGLEVASASLTARARRFAVAAAGVTGGRLDGDITVVVERGPHTLTGRAKVPVATVWLPGLAISSRHPQRIRPHDDVRFIDGASRAAAERNAAKSTAATPTRVKLEAEADAVFVRSKDLDLEIDSRLTLRSTASSRGAPVLFGAIRVRHGRINIGSQRFDFDESRITFDGAETPRLDIHLQHAYPEATVFIDIRGTTAHPDLRLRSEPSIYDQGQIISLVLTGRMSGAAGGGGSPDPTAVIATTVLGKIADKLAPQLGLDVLKIEQSKGTPEQSAAGLLAERVEIGKYVSERLYVSYAHVFGATDAQNANEAQAEYHVTADWLAQTVFGDAGVGGFDAFWTTRY